MKHIDLKDMSIQFRWESKTFDAFLQGAKADVAIEKEIDFYRIYGILETI